MQKKIDDFVDSWTGIALMWSVSFNVLYFFEVIK